MASTENHVFYKQAWACSSAYAAAMAIGASAGFSGVTIPQLQMPKDNSTAFDSSRDFRLTDDQISWFASLPTFATIPTCILGGLMGQAFGRRLSLLLAAPVFATSFICQAAAPDVVLFQFGRFLSGFAAGLVSSPAGTYVSEISHPAWRTTFGAGIGISFLIGTLIIYTLGAVCHWRTLAWISALFPALSFVAGLFSPESPAWLVTKGRLLEAKRGLMWLHSRKLKSLRQEELLDHHHHLVEAEVETLRNSYGRKKEATLEATSKVQKVVGLILRRDVWFPLIIMLALFLLQQFCGLSVISFYAVNVLAASHSSVNEYTSTIIFGLSRVAAQFLGSYLLLRLKRRILFVASASITGLGMALLALVNSNVLPLTPGEDSKEEEPSTLAAFIGTLPLIAVMMAALGYQLGLSPIAWSYSAELFPLDARAELSGLANCFGNLSIFLVVKTFPSLSKPHHLGLGGCYWLYTSVCVLNVLFGLCILPETKGKHLEDINKEFEKNAAAASPAAATSAETEDELLGKGD